MRESKFRNYTTLKMEKKTMYAAIYWAGRIKKHTVVKESEVSIWLESGSRELKSTTYQQWFNSFEEAKNHLIQSAEAKVSSLEYQIQSERERTEKIKALRQNDL